MPRLAWLCTLLFAGFVTSTSLYGQQTISGTIQHDGSTRSYLLYIPESYTGTDPVPLVFNFHGFTSSAEAQMWYGDFRAIADTAGFLVVHPQGTLLNGSTHWNVGGWTLGSTVDDVGFVASLLDTLAIDYTIDAQRVYATGMSNGGYMSFLLACQLGDRIAAIASVTGSMTPETYNNCDPAHPTPILQIHGTTDPVVPYDGALWTRSIEDVIGYWVEENACDPTANSIVLPDVNPGDGSTVVRYIYTGGLNGVEVHHDQVIGGGHTWPGSLIGGSGTNQDYNASERIWQFFARYTIEGEIGAPTALADPSALMAVKAVPNPARHQVEWLLPASPRGPVQLVNSQGVVVRQIEPQAFRGRVELHQVPTGMYVLRCGEFWTQIVVMQDR